MKRRNMIAKLENEGRLAFMVSETLVVIEAYPFSEGWQSNLFDLFDLDGGAYDTDLCEGSAEEAISLALSTLGA